MSQSYDGPDAIDFCRTLGRQLAKDGWKKGAMITVDDIQTIGLGSRSILSDEQYSLAKTIQRALNNMDKQ